MKLVSNHSFPRHAHDEYGVGVVISGAQRSWSGVGHVEALPGDVITVNPSEVHDGHPIGDDHRHWRIIYLDPAELATRLGHERVRAPEFTAPVIRNARLGRLVHALYERVAHNADALGIDELVTLLVPPLASWKTRDVRHAQCPGVAKARTRIDDDPSGPVALAELAALAGMSRYRLVRAFASELGITPYAYLMQRRVRLAWRLLKRGEDLATTAHVAGFADQSHMTRAFVRQYGISPGRLRERPRP